MYEVVDVNGDEGVEAGHQKDIDGDESAVLNWGCRAVAKTR